MENYGKSPFLMDKSTINDRMEYSKYVVYSKKIHEFSIRYVFLMILNGNIHRNHLKFVQHFRA